METKILSSAGFKHEFSIQELYVLTRHWLGDIAFFEIEIKYFQSKLDLYPGRNDQYISRADLLERQLNDVVFVKDTLKEKTTHYHQKLEALLDSPGKVNEAFLTLEYNRLEGEYGDFIRAFRQVKYAFFTASAGSENAVEMA